MIAIVVCYKTGTSPILSAWFNSVKKHTVDVAYKVVVLVERGGVDSELTALANQYGAAVVETEPTSLRTSSGIHGRMLDFYIPEKIDTEYLLTMDSDCFPVVDGWLSDMLKMMEDGAKVVGILHPWSPPAEDIDKRLLAYRVRQAHNWGLTHVACQMIRKEDLCVLNVKYVGGDDTGLLIPRTAQDKGWKIDGFKISRCPKPELGKIDPEYNRYTALVFGDKVFHLGGYTRTTVIGDKRVFDREFGYVQQRIEQEQGAEFLLADANSYKFKLDREEEIFKEKMQRLFGLKSQRMGGE